MDASIQSKMATGPEQRTTTKNAPRLVRALVLLIFIAGTGGCEPISMTALGVGGAAGVQHTLSGISYRTFTAPLSRVRSAVHVTFSRMDIKLSSTEKTGNGEVIKGTASGRNIEVELESLTAKATRMRAVARNGILMDAATATEIILQTEDALTRS